MYFGTGGVELPHAIFVPHGKPMQTYRKYSQFLYAIPVLIAIWLVAPLVAGSGDIEAAIQAWPMIDNGALLIDVRSKQEFDQGHLDGAVHIEWDRIDALAAAIGDDKNRQVVFYCRSGNRAGKSIVELRTRGYTNIFNATGLEVLRETRN